MNRSGVTYSSPSLFIRPQLTYMAPAYSCVSASIGAGYHRKIFNDFCGCKRGAGQPSTLSRSPRATARRYSRLNNRRCLRNRRHRPSPDSKRPSAPSVHRRLRSPLASTLHLWSNSSSPPPKECGRSASGRLVKGSNGPCKPFQGLPITLLPHRTVHVLRLAVVCPKTVSAGSGTLRRVGSGCYHCDIRLGEMSDPYSLRS